MKKLVCYCLAIALILSFSTPTRVSALNEAPIVNNEDFITSYDFATKRTTTLNMTDIIGSSGTQSYSSDISYPPVAPANFSPQSGQNDGEISPRYVFGGGYVWQECDPYIWGVAYIRVYWDNGDVTRGTAFVFANNALITAAHCVYNSERGGWCDYVDVYPARNDNYTPFGEHRATVVHICTDYMSSPTAPNDYAVLEVEEDIGLQTGLFGWSTSASVGTEITVIGYPRFSDNAETQEIGIKQYRDVGTITSITSTTLTSTNLDWNRGSSGGPVCKNGNYAVGIVSRSDSNGNIATRITTGISNWLSTFR